MTLITQPPLRARRFGGKNPQTPPCFQGREVGDMVVVGATAGGPPEVATMAR